MPPLQMQPMDLQAAGEACEGAEASDHPRRREGRVEEVFCLQIHALFRACLALLRRAVVRLLRPSKHLRIEVHWARVPDARVTVRRRLTGKGVWSLGEHSHRVLITLANDVAACQGLCSFGVTVHEMSHLHAAALNVGQGTLARVGTGNLRADIQFRVKERLRQMGLQQEAAAIEHRGDAQVEEADEAAPIQADVARAAQS